jgi:multiple sugar transport system permease protein
MIRRAVLSKYMSFLLLLSLVGILSFPLFITLVTSVKSGKDVYSVPTTLLPKELNFKNYLDIFRVLDLFGALRSSLIVALVAASLTVLASVPAGYALARFRFKGRRPILFMILGGLMFSPVVVIISMYQIIFKVGLMNTYLALIIPYAAFALPFSIWLMLAFINAIPIEIDESAILDGASYSRILLRVIAPIGAPGIVTVFVYAFIQAWNEFLFANTFITSDSLKTLPVRLYEFVGQRGVEWQYMTASVVFATMPTVILFLLVQKWLVKGLASGAVRG